MGSTILSVREIRKLAVETVLATIPADANSIFITVDIDRFERSTLQLPPGTGIPSHGGCAYYEVQELGVGLQSVLNRGPGASEGTRPQISDRGLRHDGSWRRWLGMEQSGFGA